MPSTVPATSAEQQSILSAQASMALGRHTARYGVLLMEAVRAGMECRTVRSRAATFGTDQPALLGL